MSDHFTPLLASTHWLGWLPPDPGPAIRNLLEPNLLAARPEARLGRIVVTQDPEFVTGGVRIPEQDNRVAVMRAGLALAVDLHLDDQVLPATFSWVATGLHRPDDRRDQVWLDLDLSLAEAKQLLAQRVYEPDNNR
ncbi:hypothetical protein SAMN04515671_1118 [Nakamurella panacisegetis]|uniref:Uncharacterized protein n=1 Tax=Nakamurella panacisegetis TaxID=1090615 RepID=A0A1H0K106_9ACTN|nr:hypothetical protein [Nakamurella panacisegetis]SDO49443.1 hypothetical protein SAMN04515671_1118 [Nakamurella panacisegetis]